MKIKQKAAEPLNANQEFLREKLKTSSDKYIRLDNLLEISDALILEKHNLIEIVRREYRTGKDENLNPIYGELYVIVVRSNEHTNKPLPVHKPVIRHEIGTRVRVQRARHGWWRTAGTIVDHHTHTDGYFVKLDEEYGGHTVDCNRHRDVRKLG